MITVGDVSRMRPEVFLLQNLHVCCYAGESLWFNREEAWQLAQEGWLKWRLRVFDSSMHMASVLRKTMPDIVVTHWHGEAAHRDLPVHVVRRLRQQRDERICNGPFLVGQFSGMDDRFDPSNPNGKIGPLLHSFDMLFERTANLERMLADVATGLWNALKREQHLALPDAPFRGHAILPPISHPTDGR